MAGVGRGVVAAHSDEGVSAVVLLEDFVYRLCLRNSSASFQDNVRQVLTSTIAGLRCDRQVMDGLEALVDSDHLVPQFDLLEYWNLEKKKNKLKKLRKNNVVDQDPHGTVLKLPPRSGSVFKMRIQNQGIKVNKKVETDGCKS